jgi:Ca-activated chloride channel family protein
MNSFGLIAQLEASRISLPLEHIEARFRVTGDLASVEMDQVFQQNARKALDVTYAFPLPGEASVFHCEMHVNDRVVRAIVMEEKEARRVVAEKKAQGHRTALVESVRDNLFTLKLGNVAPGDRIVIRFAYLQPLERLGDQLSLRVPFNPGVRYIPGKPLLRPNRGSGTCDDTDQVPDASRLSPPRIDREHPDAATIYVRGTWDADEVQAGSLNSPSHSVQVDVEGKHLAVELAGEQLVPDRDWVLRWQEAAVTEAKPKAWSCRQDEWRYGLLQLRAPQEMEAVEQFPQDVYFLLDRSGSMAGENWQQCAKALKAFVQELSPVDRVWITCFESSYQDFSDAPMLRDELLADAAFQNFDQIEAHGGTELLPALQHVLAVRAKQSQGVPSRLIIITDGQVGNEDAILELMRDPEAAQLPVHSFGIDRAVNDAFLQQLAADTGGRCTLMTPQDDIPGAVRKLACTLRRPVLNHLQLQAGVEVASPERGLRDLHAGEVLLVPVRVPMQASSQVKLTACRPDGRPWSMQWELDQAEESETARLAWAKRRIGHLQKQEEQSAAIEQAIQHNLICRGASFVAWDEAAKTTLAEQAVMQPSMETSGEGKVLSRRLLATRSTSILAAPAASRSAKQDHIRFLMMSIDTSPQPMSRMPLAMPAKTPPKLRIKNVLAKASEAPVPALANSWVKSLRKTLEHKFRLPDAIHLQIYLALLHWAGQILGGQRHKLLETWAKQLAQPDSSLDQLESLLASITDDRIQALLEPLREWRAKKRT